MQLLGIDQTWGEVDRIWAEFVEHWSGAINVDQFWSNFDRFGDRTRPSIVARTRPTLRRARPSLGQARPKLARIRPAPAKLGPESANAGPVSTPNFGPTSTKVRSELPNFGPNSRKSGPPRASEQRATLARSLCSVALGGPFAASWLTS